MAVETAPFINGLNPTLPSATDLKSEGDDHLRLIKGALVATFPNVTGAVNTTHTQINQLHSAVTSDGTNATFTAATAAAILLNSPSAVLSIFGSPAVSDGTARVEIYGTTATTPKQISYRADKHLFTTSLASVPLWQVTSTSAAFSVPVTATSFNGYLATANVSQFTNDAGYLTSIGSMPSLTVSGLATVGELVANGRGGVSAVGALRPNTSTPATFNLATTGGSTWQLILPSGSNDFTVSSSALGSSVLTFAQATGAATFNYSVTAPSFVGNLTGTATNATTAVNATNATNASVATLANSATTALGLSGNANLTASGGLTIAGTPSRFESAPITIQAGSFAYPGISHGGSRKPDLVAAYYKCTSAINGFAVGDYVQVQNVQSGGASQVWASATQVGMTQLTSSALYVKDLSTGTPLGAASNFALVFICHWL